MATVDIVKTAELSKPLEYDGRYVGINNMFYYGIVTREQTFSNNVGYDFTATVPTGYKFLCWCCYMTEGWIGNGYINGRSSSVQFWFSRNGAHSGRLRLTYLCIRA